MQLSANHWKSGLPLAVALVLTAFGRADAQQGPGTHAATARLTFVNRSPSRVLVFLVEDFRWVRLGRVAAGDSAQLSVPGFSMCRAAVLSVVSSASDRAEDERGVRPALGRQTARLEHAVLAALRWSYDGEVLSGEFPGGALSGTLEEIRRRLAPTCAVP